MKKIFLFLLLFCTTSLWAEDGLVGSYEPTSNGKILSVNIEKSNVYKITVRDKNYGVVVYVTNASDYYLYDDNVMEGSSIMRVNPYGGEPSLGNQCYLYFTPVYEGFVMSIRLRIDNVTYEFERATPNQQESTPNRTTNTSSQTTTTYNRPVQTTPKPAPQKLQNISATFGWAGNWVFKFTSYGTFSHHKFTANYYNRIIEDHGVVGGTYYIVKDSNGVKRVYLRYENGLEKSGILRYGSTTVEFSLGGKRYVEL